VAARVSLRLISPDIPALATTRGLTGSESGFVTRSHRHCQGSTETLILDRDPADPKLILATIAAPGDVELAGATGPAAMGEALA
jgi:hypothetical protein